MLVIMSGYSRMKEIYLLRLPIDGGREGRTETDQQGVGGERERDRIASLPFVDEEA